MIFYQANELYAQIEVHSNNRVKVGALGGSAPTRQFQVSEGSFLQCLPAVCGIYFESYTNSYEEGGPFNNTGNSTYYEPAIRGHWGNSTWVGTINHPMWQVRTHEIYADNVLISSDSSLKTNVVSLDSATAQLMQLRPVSYDHSAGITDDTPDERRTNILEASKNEMGFIAQELQDVYPRLVHDKGNGELAVDYISLIPVLVKAIQEQQAVIEDLQIALQALGQ